MYLHKGARTRVRDDCEFSQEFEANVGNINIIII